MRVTLGVRVSVGMRVRDGVLVTVGVFEARSVRVRVGERVGVPGVIPGVAVRARVRVGELVCVRVPVGRNVRVGVDVVLRVTVGVGVRVPGRAVPVRVGVAVGDRRSAVVGVAVKVGETLRVDVGVADGRRVDVEVAVGTGVGKGPVPTYTRICATGPGLPSTSRTRAVTRVSPSGKASVPDTARQNCVRDCGCMKR
jgi:hypothetical protein